MMKQLRFMLLTVLAMLCGSAMAQTEKTVTWKASSHDALSTINVGNDVTLKWEEGGGDLAPKYSGDHVYFYNGNRVTVAGASSEVTIKKVVFTFRSENDPKIGMVTCNASGKNTSSTGITNDNSSLTTTWQGEQNSVTFRAAQSTGARYIESIAVTYIGASTEEKAPVLSITNANIADTYNLDDNPVFTVYYTNEGTAAAENAKLTLYVDNAANNVETIGTLAFGTDGWKNFKYDATTITAGAHQVYVALTADNAEAFTTDAKTVTFTKNSPEATFELTAQNVELQLPAETLTAVVNVKNTSSVAATNVVVNLHYNGTIGTQTIASLAAGANKDITFEVSNPFATAGEYEVQALTQDNKYGCKFNVTVLAAPVVPQPDMAVTAIQGVSQIDLTQENKIQVWFKNEGNVDVENATLTVKLNGTKIGEETVAAKVDKNGFKEFTLPLGGLVAGEKATVEATVSVEGDVNAQNNTMTHELDIIGAVVAEPTFELTAQPVEVQLPADNVTVVVSVKNTSETDATNVEVKLMKSTEQMGDTQTIAALAAGESKEATFTFANPYATDGTYELQAIAGKYGCFVTVTVKPVPVTPVIDVSLIAISGLEKISLNQTNTVMVTFQNNSNVDVENASITLRMNGTEVGTQTIDKGDIYKSFTLPTEGLVAGEEATLVATLTVEGNKEGNLVELTKTLPIVSGDDVTPTEPTFELSVANVEATVGETINATVNVKNTSEVDATDIAVVIYKGMDVLATETIASLAAGADQDVVMNLGSLAVGQYEMQAVVGTVNKYFDVKVSEAAPDPVVDLAVTSINGTLSMDVENSYVTVYVENLGTVDVTDAVVTLKAGEVELGKGTVTVKAGKTAFCSIAVAGSKLTVGDMEVVALVEAENDADTTNNQLSKTYTIAAPEVTLSFTATANFVTATSQYTVTVVVTNESTVGNAENVAVKVFGEDSKELGSAVIASIAAGDKQTAVITGTTDRVMNENSRMQVMVNSDVKWVNVELTDTTTGVGAVKAQYGSDATIYTLSGKKVAKVRKGAVCIVNGKKVVVK